MIGQKKYLSDQIKHEDPSSLIIICMHFSPKGPIFHDTRLISQATHSGSESHHLVGSVLVLFVSSASGFLILSVLVVVALSDSC